MTDLLNNFDLRQNFWEANPSFLAVKEFKELFDSDKSKAKALSSETMWAISLLVHPKSLYANATYEDRLNLINNDRVKENNQLDPEKEHRDLIQTYQRLAMTRTQRIARQWGDKLDERFKFIDSLEYNITNVETLDKMMQGTEKLWKHYMTCLKDLEEENAASQVMGGATESLAEQNRI